MSIVSIFSNWSEHHETSSWLKFGSILERSERTEKKKRFRFGFRHFGSKRLKKRAIVRESDPKEEKRLQGCPAAPFIYAAWTFRISRLLDVAWCQHHLSFFADDIHAFWKIFSTDAFHSARFDILRILDILHRHHMQVNLEKSSAVMLLRGTEAGKIKQRFQKWHTGQYWLRVGAMHRGQSDTLLPIRGQLEYLGTTLSYAIFEQSTFTKRAKQAWSTFHRLRPALRTQGPLSLAQRVVRLFKVFVLPTLMYGIAFVGITPTVAHNIISTLSQMLRKVLRVHEHGIPNVTVLLRAKIQPELFVQTELRSKWRAVSHDTLRCDALRAEALLQIDQHQAQASQSFAQCERTLIAVDSPIDAASCPTCGISFVNQEALNAHISAKHSYIHKQARITFDCLRHALFGVPICRLCRGRQYDWISLERHITEGRCPRLKQAAAASLTPDQILAEVEREEHRNPPEPPPTTRAPFLEQHQHILQVSSHALPEHHDQIFTLRDRCALCNQQFKSGLRIKPHWQQIHPVEWEHSNKDAISQLGSLQAIFRTPCQFCGSTAKAGNHRSTQHAQNAQLCSRPLRFSIFIEAGDYMLTSRPIAAHPSHRLPPQ